MENQIPEVVKKERVKKIMELSRKLEEEYMLKFVGSEVVFIPEVKKDNYLIGHTGNYLLVKTESNCKLKHDNMTVKISKVEYPYVIGMLTK